MLLFLIIYNKLIISHLSRYSAENYMQEGSAAVSKQHGYFLKLCVSKAYIPLPLRRTLIQILPAWMRIMSLIMSGGFTPDVWALRYKNCPTFFTHTKAKIICLHRNIPLWILWIRSRHQFPICLIFLGKQTELCRIDMLRIAWRRSSSLGVLCLLASNWSIFSF